MANQAETSTFPAVYQWEVNDPVMGGLGGLDNLPLLQLTARTRFVLDANAALAAVVATLAPNNSPSLTGSPLSVTPPQDAIGKEIATAGFVRGLANGFTALTISGNTYLTVAQASVGIINVGGTLAADAYLLFPPMPGRWIVLNATQGGFRVLCRYAAGGLVVPITDGRVQTVWGDAVNILGAHTDYDSIGMTGTPTAPVPVDTEDSAIVPTTSWVRRIAARIATTIVNAALGSFVTNNLAMYPNTCSFQIGPIIFQMFSSPPVDVPNAGSSVSFPFSFPTPFPHGCAWMCAVDGGYVCYNWSNIDSVTAAGGVATVIGTVGTQPGSPARGHYLAIGW